MGWARLALHRQRSLRIAVVLLLTRFEVCVCLFWDLVYREVSWGLGEAYLVLKAES